MKKLTVLIICSLLSWEIYSQNSPDTIQNKNERALHLCFETLVPFFIDSNYYNLAQLTKEKALEYNIDEIRIAGGKFLYNYLYLKDFPLIKPTGDQKLLNAFRRELQWFKDKGIKITIYVSGEPKLPGVVSTPTEEKSFFDLYPEAKYLDNGLLWKFFEERTSLFFKLVPEADAISFHLWETPLLDDLNFFTGIKWLKDPKWSLGSKQYYSQADYITELIAAFSRGAAKAGKEMSVLSFCHYPHQENLLVESFTELEKRNTPMVLVHKSQPGDWDPYRGPNNVLLHTNSQGMLLFDGVGEYWGGSRVPYCFPEEIQYRLLDALNNNKNIKSVAMRVFDFFDYGTLFDNYNEINFFALSKFAEDPATPVEEIWQEWANRKFGEKAAPKLIEVLKRSDDIGKLVYYFKGIWVQQHSLIASLDYIEAQVLHTGRAMLDWYPNNIIDNGLIQEFLYHPTEAIIQIAVNDRKYALDLCNQSIQDVESVEKWLTKNEYQKLIGQLHVQKRFVEVSILHIEAYLRYKIYQNDPGNENNYHKLLPILTALEKIAKEIDSVYNGNERLLSEKKIMDYVNDIRIVLK